MKIRYFFTVLILSFQFGYSQTNASSIWPLTSNQNPTIGGNVNAKPQYLMNMQVNYTNGIQRSSPSGTAGSWPLETTENSTRYMEFAITPVGGNILTVNSISMILYTNSGSGMRVNVYYSKDADFTTRFQIGSTYTLTSTELTTPNVTATPNIIVNQNETLYVRVYPWYTSSTTGKYLIVKNVTISGTTVPSISILPSTLNMSGFIQQSASVPSTPKTYKLSGSNLTNDVIITPSQNFEISADDGLHWVGHNNSLTIPVSEGIILHQPRQILVRLKADTAGEYSGTLTHVSANALDVVIKLYGVFIANEPTIPSLLSVDSITGTTAFLSFTGGNGSRRIVAICEGTTMAWRPTDAVPLYGVSGNYQQAINQGDGTKIVYDGSESSCFVTHLQSNKTYTVAVFEYNVATGNSYNYLTSNFSLITFTTLIVPSLSLSPSSIDFGSVLVNSSSVKTYVLTGQYLKANDTVKIIATDNFSIAKEGTDLFSQQLSLPYSGTEFQTTIMVRFSKNTPGQYTGIIKNFGGNADTVFLNVRAKSVSTLVNTDEPVGFATLGKGTAGGSGGTEVFVKSAQQLADIMKAREGKSTTPLIVYISETLTGYSTQISVKRTANISILGVGNNAGFLGFGMKIVECNNIIVRNLTFADCHVDEKDALAIDNSYNIWVDHCTFTDSPSIDLSGSNHDGQLDVKNGSYNVTISYNRFSNHRKTCLLGHTTNQLSDTTMKVTYYRNWFDGTNSRHPRVRYAKAHIVNNLYSNITGYGVGVTCNGQIYLENNYFENTQYPVLISQVNDVEKTLSGDPVGYIKTVGNFTVNSGFVTEYTGNNDYWFYPSDYYTYSAVEGSEVKTLVQENAGAGIITIVTTIDRENQQQPKNLAVLQNYPNPFNPMTTILFTLPRTLKVTVKVFDLLGREVDELFNDVVQMNVQYCVQFNASRLPTGIYVCRVDAGEIKLTRKLLLVK